MKIGDIVVRKSYGRDITFKILDINNGIYDKNIIKIFDITAPFIDKAIQRSKSLIYDYGQVGNFCPSKMNPCTTVQELVEELMEYTKAQS